MKTYMKTSKDLENRGWFLFDAKDKVLGRLASEIANILRGKNKPDYTPHMDSGDFVVVVNADKVRLTGNKMKNKIYYRHTGYIGGLKKITAEELLAKHPGELLKKAVKGMLPKTRLGKKLIGKLKVYAGENHPHSAQKPKVVK